MTTKHSSNPNPTVGALSAISTGVPHGWEDPRRAARRLWWLCATVLNVALLPLAVGGRAIEASLAALLVAVLCRHDGAVAFLGHLTTRRPGYRRHQLVYHLGQLHRAMALAGTSWLILAVLHEAHRPYVSVALALVTVALAAMAWTARDSARTQRHDQFEVVHRLVVWATLGLLVIVVAGEAQAAWSSGTPQRTLWLLGLLSLVVAVCAHPWTTVRRLPMEILDVTPGLVVLAFPGGRRVGDFLRVSLDGREWHSFAVSTCGREGPDRFCLVIRRAGDWTEHLGARCEGTRPPRSMLVRQLRGFGFMGHLLAYRQPLVVATGAGIGPVLLYLLDQPEPGLHCVWVGRDHRRSVGADLVSRVLARGQVTLVDTATGRPDMASLVSRYAKSSDAVFVVSNPPVRDQVAAACSDLGLRCYGPTFDS